MYAWKWGFDKQSPNLYNKANPLKMHTAFS